ncbi:hypothetical protein H8K52_18380 [Undibacterium seohonense]|uniref:Uncharacterized protein n=1 Tax=Undibacterium seohonense TaxID=1344950 RepID=A0ABR6XA87_9BURK|nr:hypothetical protein [Undibacterium seohonense]MBC3809311.1 hypothetical protein [Undibacterium seohonense]
MPKAASEAFDRLIAQIKSGRETHGSIAVVFGKEFKPKEKQRILDALGDNKGGVELISGFVGLAHFLTDAFIDMCF